MKFTYEKYPMLKELLLDEGFFVKDKCLFADGRIKGDSFSLDYITRLESYYQYIRFRANKNVFFVTKPIIDILHSDTMSDKLRLHRDSVKSTSGFFITHDGIQLLYDINNFSELGKVTLSLFVFSNPMDFFKNKTGKLWNKAKLHYNDVGHKSVLINFVRCYWNYGSDPFSYEVYGDDTFNITDSFRGVDFADYVLCYELFKQYAELETAYVQRDKRSREKVGKEKFLSKEFPYKIDIITSNWFTEIVRSEGFSVKGHFRLQPCGKGMKDRKLVWINPFQKDGYTLRARKTVNN